MQKINLYKVVFSSIFFILFVITSLSLLLSTFAHDFTQLFSIFNKHFYRPLIFFLYVCGVFMSLIYLVLCAWHKNHALIPQIVAFIGGVLFIYLCFIPPIPTPTFLFAFFFYLAFFLLGMIWFHFRSKKFKNKYLILFAPSLNTCLVTLFASGLQTYFLTHSLQVWFDWILFCLGLVLLLVLLARHKEYFGLYEYANLLVLIAGILVFLLSAPILFQIERYNEARWSFYLLGFLGWYGEWMYTSFKNDGVP